MAQAIAPTRVTRRDRPVAYFVTGGLALLVIILVLVEIIKIIQARRNPETITTFRNGADDIDGLPRWGRMPYFFVRSQKAPGVVKCPLMSDIRFADTGLGADAKDSFKKLSDPSCKQIDHTMVRLDFTTILPIFGTGRGGRGDNVFEFPQTPTIDVRFAVAGTDGVDLFFAKPTAPEEAVNQPWQDSGEWMRYIGGIGDLSDTQGQYVHTHVSKGFQPSPGVYWGFNPGEVHIEETMDVSYSGYHPKTVPLYTKSNASGVNFGWRIDITSPVMMERRPISIVMQIFTLLSKVGGWLTMATAVFYIFFTNKYPKSREEEISQRLALRWRREETREVTSAIELRAPCLYSMDSMTEEDLTRDSATRPQQASEDFHELPAVQTSIKADDAGSRGTG